MNQPPHHFHAGDVARLLETDCQNGLSDPEVRRVVEAMARDVLHVLGFARRSTHSGHQRHEHQQVGQGITFLSAGVRIGAVALAVFLIVEFEKWLRFGGERGKNRIPD